MQQTQILLKKRPGKFVLYLIAALFCVFVTLGAVINIITSGFGWFVAGVGVVTLLCLFFVISGLAQYFSNSAVWLVAESNGETLVFFNKNQAGKVFNKSEEIKLAPIKRFYIIKKRTRYFSDNYAFGYHTGKILGREEISAFPPLFEATQADMNNVLMFVKTVRPEIELGYESFIQKLAKG